MKLKTFVLVISMVILPGAMARASSTLRYAPMSQELIKSGTRIIDIRTEKEWRETGVVKGALLITFFREDMTYDQEAFLAKLRRHVKPSDKIAIMCRSGNRSAKVGRFLMQKGFTEVINVDGGIKRAKEAGISLDAYQPTAQAPTVARK